MNLFDVVSEVRRHLEENGRLSLRMLRRQFELDDDTLEEVIEELVDVQGIARRDGTALAWASAPGPSATTAAAETRHPSPPLAGERKIVTIVFADLAGSTALQERLDAESARVFMQRYYEAMRGAVVAHGGTVAKLLGDGVLAFFGTPRVAEDDAPRAVHAAFEMHRAFCELAEEHTALVGALGLRVAVNTGEVVASGDAEIVGDPVNVAARLQEQCRTGEVVVGEATHRLVSQLVTLTPLGSLALKGRAEAVKAYRVESLERPSGVIQAPFVGRDDELARMTAVLEKAVAKPETALALLLGSPGLGKSRLIHEFSERLADTAHVVSAHCNEGSGTTFAPLVLALRECLEIDARADATATRAAIEAAIPGDDADRARIANGIAALFAGSPSSPEETFFVVRRFFAALATARPVILVIDDLQWAEPMLLDLVEHLVEWGGTVPMLVLVGARPELRAKRSSLVTPGGFVSDVVTLAGLDASAAMRLAANVIGASDLPAAVAAKVLATSEGNPLFVGELVRMLVHEGALKNEGGRWTTGTALAALEMPPTIHALLAARIERLQPAERIVLERAAVVGRHFSRTAVAALLPGDVADLDARLESLQRSELIERDTGWFLGEPGLRFHHVLIRDAAYRQLLKGSRAELHSRFSDWVLKRAGASVDHDETIGWHLEQAHILLGELGPIDADGRAIGARASKHLAAAGRRALAGDDVSLAASLLGRAIERLDPDDPWRSELALDWCEALLAAGDVVRAREAIDELDRFVGDSDRLRAWHTCFAGQHTVLTAPEGLESTASAVAAAADSLAGLDDHAGEAKAHFVHALALASLGRIGACETALDRALAAARRIAGDRRRANTVLAVAPLAALWGPSPVTRASGRCLDVVRVLRITQGAPAVEAVALSCQGVLEALRGRTDAARRMIASSREMVEELGITQRLLEVDVSSGLVDLLEGDAASAERSLRTAYDGMRELGLGIDAARAAALLARALLALDQAAEAETLSHESEALAGDDLKAAIAWRGVRAEALARRGEHTAAVEFATKAVEIAAATDALLDHADARLALAAALRAAGRGRDADAEEHRAHELWEAKGASLLAERGRSGAAPAAPVPASAPAQRPTASAPERAMRANAATATGERLEARVAARELTDLPSMFTEDDQEDDHPTGTVFGRDARVSSLRSLMRSDDPFFDVEWLASLGSSLALARRRSGARRTDSGRYDVGAYESEAIHVMEVDGNGCFTGMEVFAADRLDEAIVRLYARHAELLPVAADRARATTTARVVAEILGTQPDPDRFAALMTPEIELVDHRTLGFGSVRGIDGMYRYVRAFVEQEDAVLHVHDIFALRPDAALILTVTVGTSRTSGGAYERPMLQLWTFADDGRLDRMEQFDSENEAEALARYEEIVGPVASVPRLSNAATRVAAQNIAAWLDKDWDRFAARFPPDFHASDRRRGVLLELGRDEMIAFSRSLGETATTRTIDSEPLALRGQRLALMRWRIVLAGDATAGDDVGPAELVHLNLFEVDEDGALVSVTRWDDDDLAAALAEVDARAAAIGEPVVGTRGLPTRTVQPPAPTASRSSGASLAGITTSNAAAIASHRFQVAYDVFADTGDDGQVRSICAPRLAYEDRRRMALLSGDVELMLASVRERAAIGARLEYGLVGTAGDRIGIGTCLWSGGPPDGRFEIEYLVVAEVDEAGLISAFVLMDLDDPRAAQREAWARWAAIDPDVPDVVTPIGEAVDAFNQHDATAFRAAHTSDLVVDDHRLAGVGRIEGADAYTESIVALWELAPTAQVSNGWSWLALDPCGGVTVLRRTGTLPDGGDFESEYLFLFFVDLGRFAHIELFELHALDEALARFEALRSDPLRRPPASARRTQAGFSKAGQARAEEPCPDTQRKGGASFGFEQGDVAPNAASEATARWHDTFAACVASDDWGSLRAEYPEDAIFADRQRHSLVAGDRAMGLASARERAAAGARPQSRLLATVGQRIAISRMLWSGGPADGRFEVEHLALGQVDASGRLAATILFDVDDMDGARREAWERWAAIEPAVAPHLELLTTLMDVWNSHDATLLSAPFADDIVVEDHRLAGIGRLEGGDAYRRANEALWDLAPDQRIEFGASLCAYGPHGMLATLRRYGTLPDDGDFDSVYLNLLVAKDGRVTRSELFEIDALDEALARFEELRPDPLRVPQNEAALALQGLRTANSDDAFRALLSEDFVFDDRRKRSLVVGGIEDWRSSREFLTREAGARVDFRLLAAPGRRCALLHACWAGGPPDGRFDIEHLVLVEVDASGLFTAFMLFDPGDRAAAYAELSRRCLNILAVEAPRGAVDFWSGLNEHDLVRARSGLVDDFVLRDHRRTGMGVLEGADAYIASVSALYELSGDVTVQPLWTAAIEAHGRVEVLRRTGTNSEGGEFEGIFISLSLTRGQQLSAFEYFEPEDLDKALARLEELRPRRAVS